MNVMTKKCTILATREVLTCQFASYSKKWPDDKWVLMNSLRQVGNWWRSRLDSLDNYCRCLHHIYPDMPPKTNPDHKMETIRNNMKTEAIKYWCARGICLIRGKIVAVQAMEWHIATHNFIVTNIRKGIALSKSFLEKNLLEEEPSSSDALNRKCCEPVPGGQQTAEKKVESTMKSSMCVEEHGQGPEIGASKTGNVDK